MEIVLKDGTGKVGFINGKVLLMVKYSSFDHKRHNMSGHIDKIFMINMIMGVPSLSAHFRTDFLKYRSY